MQQAGADYIEESVQRFLCPERPREDFLAQLSGAADSPLAIEAANTLLPPDMKLVDAPGWQADRRRIERYMRTALERAAEAGIGLFVFGSGAARFCPAGCDPGEAERQIGEYLAVWSAWARSYGIVIALEPLHYEETNTLNTLAEGGALVSSIADSGARLLADLYHMACNGEGPDCLLPWSAVLAHVHVAERKDRAAPGRYGEDFRPYLGALRHSAYDGRISIECDWIDFEAEVGPAVASLREQWAAAGV
jgi:sugar phosphate isomerase/epimerase